MIIGSARSQSIFPHFFLEKSHIFYVLEVRMLLYRFIRVVVGFVMLGAGVVTFPLPIPVGLVLIAGSFLILIPVIPLFRRLYRMFVRRYPRIALRFKIMRRRIKWKLREYGLYPKRKRFTGRRLPNNLHDV